MRVYCLALLLPFWLAFLAAVCFQSIPRGTTAAWIRTLRRETTVCWQVLHTRDLVETIVLQLLAYPRGVPYSQLKMIVKHGMRQMKDTNKGRIGYADMEVEGVMEALGPFLVPKSGVYDELVCFEHNMLRAAAYSRYVILVHVYMCMCVL
jgi:hypothetical protein